MSLISSNRFVDNEEGLAKELLCSICLEIFKHAVDTRCGHTFCKRCIFSVIQIGSTYRRLVCPECRHKSKIANHESDEALVKTNYRINAVVSKLKISCNFADNGCKEVIEFGSLSAHLKDCPFNPCSNCGLTLAVKQENEYLKSENQKLTDKCRELSEKCEELDVLGEHTRREEAIPWPAPYRTQRCQHPDCWAKYIYVAFERYDYHCKRAKLQDDSVGHTWGEGGWLEPIPVPIPDQYYCKKQRKD